MKEERALTVELPAQREISTARLKTVGPMGASPFVQSVEHKQASRYRYRELAGELQVVGRTYTNHSRSGFLTTPNST